MSAKYRIVILILVALLLSVAVLSLSVSLLPDAPISPTATYPKGIDFPDARDVPRR